MNIRRPVSILNVLCSFNLSPVSKGTYSYFISIPFQLVHLNCFHAILHYWLFFVISFFLIMAISNLHSIISFPLLYLFLVISTMTTITVK